MARANFTSIPFSIEAHQGLSKADGIAKFSSAGVILEFEMKFLGLINTGVKEARLPVEEILEIRFKKGFFRYSAKIEIRMSSFLKLSEVPNQSGKIILKIPRDHHVRAAEAVAVLQRNLSEYEASLPPPQTQVESLFEHDEPKPDDLKTSELITDKLDNE